MNSIESGPKDHSWIDEIRESRERQTSEEAHESLPFENEVFPVQEVEEIIAINKRLAGFVKESELSQNSSESLQEVIEYLDSLDLWILKFGTGEEGVEKTSDSLYYVTPTGASLRLKRSNLEKRGLKAVVQPFMECIFFEEGKDFQPTEHLSLGSTTMEYCSQEFYDLQMQDGADKAFVSPIKKFYRDGKLLFVQKPERLFHQHNGTSINRLYKSKI